MRRIIPLIVLGLGLLAACAAPTPSSLPGAAAPLPSPCRAGDEVCTPTLPPPPALIPPATPTLSPSPCAGGAGEEVCTPTPSLPSPCAEAGGEVCTPVPDASLPFPCGAEDCPAASPSPSLPSPCGTGGEICTPTPGSSDPQAGQVLTPQGQSWQRLPVIPTVSPAMRAVYQKGLALGNNPHAFSKVGDCETSTPYFLWDFDLGSKNYRLGDYSDLVDVISYYAGSFERPSLAAKPGYWAVSVLTPLQADPQKCQPGETPLACEYRSHRPSLALIMFGTNDVSSSRQSFEKYMRMIIEQSLQVGVVPVLATKADNLERDGSINALIARLAAEYQLPLWNMWAVFQPLPDHGLQPDGSHLIFARNFFDDPAAMQAGWPVRNLSALQVLQTVQKGLQ